MESLHGVVQRLVQSGCPLGDVSYMHLVLRCKVVLYLHVILLSPQTKSY